MAEIEGATITLKAGDYIDVYILRAGQLLPVRIRSAEAAGPAGGPSAPPLADGTSAPPPVDGTPSGGGAEEEHLPPNIELPPEPGVKVVPIRYPGGGGAIASVMVGTSGADWTSSSMILHSGKMRTDIQELLATVADEDRAGLGDITVTRASNARSGQILIEAPLNGEISLDMKDLGGLLDE